MSDSAAEAVSKMTRVSARFESALIALKISSPVRPGIRTSSRTTFGRLLYECPSLVPVLSLDDSEIVLCDCRLDKQPNARFIVGDDYGWSLGIGLYFIHWATALDVSNPLIQSAASLGAPECFFRTRVVPDDRRARVASASSSLTLTTTTGSELPSDARISARKSSP